MKHAGLIEKWLNNRGADFTITEINEEPCIVFDEYCEEYNILSNKNLIDVYLNYEEVFYCEGCNKYHIKNEYTTNYVILNDCMMFCEDCIRNNEDIKADYITYCNGNENIANTILDEIDLIEAGYHRCNGDSYETGLYEGMNDSPAKIVKELHEKGIYDFIFTIDNNNPFMVAYSLYVK